jgi:nitrilase
MNPRSQTMQAAAIQMVTSDRVDTNLARADALLAEAARRGARLAVLPEYFCLMAGAGPDRPDAREPAGSGPIQDFLADAARRHGLWLVGGSMPLVSPDPERVYNTSLVFDPQGSLQVRYDKRHLFAFQRGQERYAESDTIAPGAATAAFDCEGLRIGLSICYDLRFPEHYRALSHPAPCDAFMVPAAFTYTTGEKHWELLLRARAVENLAYVIASAQGGRHVNGRRTWGHSMIVDPWGEVLAMQSEGEGVVIAAIERARIAEHRAMLPALAHRQPG